MISQVKFSVSKPGGDRIHFVCAEDVRVLLGRLPYETWQRLRAVHFNDCGGRLRCLGYVTRGRQEIALCALPPRIALTRALRGQSARQFGVEPGRKWPVLAVRRFMLYTAFLHELGHLQLIDKTVSSPRRRFADEKLAEDFAREWCDRLWSQPFSHPDPVHNAPTVEELELVLEKSRSIPQD